MIKSSGAASTLMSLASTVFKPLDIIEGEAKPIVIVQQHLVWVGFL
jgi:hypothetical protein